MRAVKSLGLRGIWFRFASLSNPAPGPGEAKRPASNASREGPASVPRGEKNSRRSRLEEDRDAHVGRFRHAPRRRRRRRRKTCPVVTASTHRRNLMFSELTPEKAAKHHAPTMQSRGLYLFSRQAWEWRNYFDAM